MWPWNASMISKEKAMGTVGFMPILIVRLSLEAQGFVCLLTTVGEMKELEHGEMFWDICSNFLLGGDID